MGSKTHKTAVVIIPRDEVWPPIQALRKEYDRHFQRWMPHITLMYPFRPVHEFDALSEPFTRTCADLRPFELELATFNVFGHSRRSSTLWLAPEPKNMIVDLQTALWRVVPDCDEVRQHPNGFTPHLSIGNVRKRTIAMRLIADWQAVWTPVRFEVSEICLIWRDDPPDDIFCVGRRIPLGSK